MTAAEPDQKPLSDIARQVAECYAVIHPASPSRSKAMKWINAARRAVSGLKGIVSAEMSQAVEELVAAGILAPSLGAGHGVPARGPCAMHGTITRFCESALERGTAWAMLEGLDDELYRPSWAPVPELPEHLEQHVRLALMCDDFARFADTDLPLHIWLWLTEPRAKRHLARLPERERRDACAIGLSWLTRRFRRIDVFAGTCHEVAPSPTAKLLTARAYVLQGRLDEARTSMTAAADDPAIDKGEHVECEALRAVVAMIEGDDARAFEAVTKAVEIERSGTRKRIVYPASPSMDLALPALIRLGTPEARASFGTLLEARRKLKLGSELDVWLLAAAAADDPHAAPLSLHGQGPVGTIDAFCAIASRWNRRFHFRRDDETMIARLEELFVRAESGGYAWIVAELQPVLEAAVSNPRRLSEPVRTQLAARTADERHAAIGSRSLVPLVRPVEPWEHALRRLEQLAASARPSKPARTTTSDDRSKRIVWQIDVSPYDEDDIGVTPLEQTRRKGGRWSGGRRIALKRLLEQADGLEHLSDHDRKAAQTIRKIQPSGWYGGSPSYETDERTLHRLAGHPLVVDVDGGPVDVVEVPPELHVERDGGAARVEIRPAWTGRHYQSRFDPTDRRLEVTHFTAAHRRIAEAMPPDGLTLPERAAGRLDELLGALSADIAVHGDGASAPTTGPAGDPEPLLVLEPAGDGLRVRVRVEPLGGSGAFFDAGSGGATVYVQTPDGSVAVQRDLAAERERMDALVGSVDVLAARFDGRPQLVLEGAAEALELLDDAQRRELRCVWPGEIPFRLKARADLRQVSLRVTSAKEWFAADGELAIGDESIALARLLQLMRERPDSRFVELGRGEFLALSSTLKQQLDTLQAFSQPAPKDADARRVHPMALLALDPLIDNATLTADAAWKRLRRRVAEASADEPTVPGALTADLRGYQRDGFAWLARLARLGAGACLADDMGLGKTVQTLALLLSRAEGGPQLVVAPTSVIGNWFAEAQRFAPSLRLHDYGGAGGDREALLAGLGPFDLVVASYGLLVNDAERLAGVHWHSAVLDEAQAIKNAATRRARSARALVADCRVITTGTPVQNDLTDLHSLFAFLNPRLLGSEAAFRKRFALPITRDDDAHAREQLQRLVAPFLLRRHKRDVLRELPPRTDVTLEVTLSEEEAALYESLRRDALDALETGGDGEDGRRKFEVLSHLTRLRRLCCHPALVAPGWSGPASKLALFTETLEELIAGGHKALVFSQFVDNLKLAEAALRTRAIAYQYIDGSVGAAQRTARVDAFQRGDGDAFLISLTAGGTGLNLTAADYVIHLDPWWNPAVEDQASDRAHRLGQQRPVTILRMVTRGTIEQRIQALHGSKRELADSVLSGTGGAALDLETMLSLLGGDDEPIA